MFKKLPYYYTAFGLTLASEIEFPYLHAISPSAEVDVSIVMGKIAHPKADQAITMLSPQQMLINIGKVAHCLVEEGKKITVDPVADVPMQNIRVYLQGIVMVALLYQKSIIPLHACGVVHNDQCFVFAGESGIGKSTLAAAFLKRGFRVVCDDLCIIRKNKEGEYCVYPGYPNIKLWKNSLEKLTISSENLNHVYAREEKFYFPLKEVWDPTPVKIGGINFLRRTEKDTITIQPLDTLVKLSVFASNLFRPYIIGMLDLNQQLFEFSTRLIQQVPMYAIERPENKFMLDELVDTLISDVIQ